MMTSQAPACAERTRSAQSHVSTTRHQSIHELRPKIELQENDKSNSHRQQKCVEQTEPTGQIKKIPHQSKIIGSNNETPSATNGANHHPVSWPGATQAQWSKKEWIRKAKNDIPAKTPKTTENQKLSINQADERNHDHGDPKVGEIERKLAKIDALLPNPPNGNPLMRRQDGVMQWTYHNRRQVSYDKENGATLPAHLAGKLVWHADQISERLLRI